MLGLSACALALVPACTGSGSGSSGETSAGSDAPGEFAADFDVEAPLQVVAGDGHAWVLTREGSGAVISRVDHTGRSTDVVRLPGRSHQMAPYQDGVVVARMACDAEDCVETAAKVTVLDGTGATVTEEGFARVRGGIDGYNEVALIGVDGDVVWIDTSDGLIGYDVAAGDTVARGPSAIGVTCLLDGGLHTLVPLDGQYAGHAGVIVPGVPDPQYEVEVHRLVDGVWTPVPGSGRTLTDVQIQLARCLGGGVYAGSQIDVSPVWSPSSGWVDRGPYLRYPDLAVAPEPVAQGSADQLFVLERAGVIRRWFAGPDGPMSAETLDVPADIFVQPYAPMVQLLVDRSSTVLVGCVGQLGAPPSRCYISSP